MLRAGRIFIRRIYKLLAQTTHFKQHYLVYLSSEAQADIDWRVTFVQAWNGISLLRPLRAVHPNVDVWSGCWGCGAYCTNMWFQVLWNWLPIATQSIAAKKLFPVVVAAIVWGHAWRGRTVCFQCDNIAVVEVINHLSARDALMCHQLRSLIFASARFNFDFVAKHTSGTQHRS